MCLCITSFCYWNSKCTWWKSLNKNFYYSSIGLFYISSACIQRKYIFLCVHLKENSIEFIHTGGDFRFQKPNTNHSWNMASVPSEQNKNANGFFHFNGLIHFPIQSPIICRVFLLFCHNWCREFGNPFSIRLFLLLFHLLLYGLLKAKFIIMVVKLK